MFLYVRYNIHIQILSVSVCALVQQCLCTVRLRVQLCMLLAFGCASSRVVRRVHFESAPVQTPACYVCACKVVVLSDKVQLLKY